MEETKRFLLTDLDHRSPVVEAFRTLRANIRFVGVEKPLQSLLVTSSAPTEGKSSVIANLAVAYAMSGINVLLIDADLRRPSQHKFFKVSGSFGLTNVLLGQRTVSDSVQSTKIEGLSLLASGPLPPNPAELLGSAQMDKVFSEVKAGYELVLIDTPPVLAVSDALLLAPKVEGTLLVVAALGTKRDAAKAALSALKKANARVVGSVLNNFQLNQPSYYYYYYYGQDGEQ
jgi:capsular exopolysaccharide synthesis family protein